MPISIPRSNSVPRVRAAEQTLRPSPGCAMARPGRRRTPRSTAPGRRRAHRYELDDDPSAQVTYHSVPLQKGVTATLRPQGLGSDAGNGIHPADCQRQSCRADTRSHGAADPRIRHAGWRWAPPPGRFKSSSGWKISSWHFWAARPAWQWVSSLYAVCSPFCPSIFFPWPA